ncbi:MAG: restriction endonuclease subunit S [Leptospiraceae bacterium]|nr:restriction endonuclease subunit S [Leptospiraceae bacterium]
MKKKKVTSNNTTKSETLEPLLEPTTHKSGWEVKKLGDLFEITSSKRVFKEDWRDAGVPFYRAREIVKLAENGFVNNELFISEDMFKKYSEKYGLPKADDIMVTGVGTLGICYVVKKEDRFYFKDGNIIWLKTKGKADSRFVEYAFKSDYLRKQIDDSIGATVGTYTIIKAKNTKIPIPPLSEQKRIVAVLDKCFAAIDKAKANAEKNYQNAKELFESYLQEVFEEKVQGDSFETLDNLCELIVDCEHKTAPTQEEGYPSIRTSNIGKGELILENVNRVSYETYLKWTKRAVPKAGDLILAREASAGNIAVIPENLEVCLGQRTVLIRPKKEKLLSKYLAFLILSKDVQEILLSHSTGATVQHINMKDIRAFKIFNLSDLKTQQAIVKKLDALRAKTQRLEEIYKKKIANLEDLKKSILQKAFSGGLV